MSKSPADSLRKLSDGLQSTIDDKFRDRLENTHKRAREAESQREDGRRLQKVQDKLRALADAWDAGTLPPMLKQVTTKGMVDRLTSSKYFPSATHDAALYKAFVKAGIPNQPRYDLARETLLSLGDPNAGQKTKEDQIREAKAALLGLKFNDFFPTPDAVVERMLELAEIEDGMKVWEPSAGWGNIADAIKARYPSIVVEVTEVSYKLREILALKGHKILEPHDCLEHTGRPFFDRVLMNPPFSNNQDIAHVRHAFTLLKPGGRLVAVMCEHGFFGNEKACQEFRDWYPEIGFDEELPDGAFLESERSTGVKTRLIVLEKPAITIVQKDPVIVDLEAKIAHCQDIMDKTRPIWDKDFEAPGAFVTGRSNRPKSLDRMVDRENKKHSDAFARYQKAEKDLRFYQDRLAAYQAGEVHANGQPRADAPSRQRQDKVREDYGAFIRATIKPGDKVALTFNPRNTIKVLRLNPKSITDEMGELWKYDDVIPLLDGVAMTNEQLRAALKEFFNPTPICDTCGQPNRLVLDDAPVGKRKCWTCLNGEIKDLEQQRKETEKKMYAMLDKLYPGIAEAREQVAKPDENMTIQVGSVVRRDQAYIGVITSIKGGRCHGRITQPLDPRIKSMKHFASDLNDLVVLEDKVTPLAVEYVNLVNADTLEELEQTVANDLAALESKGLIESVGNGNHQLTPKGKQVAATMDWIGKRVKHRVLPRTGIALDVSERGVLVACEYENRNVWYPPGDAVLVEASAIVPVSSPIFRTESLFQWFRLNDEEREDLELAYETYVADIESGDDEPGWQFPLTASEQINFENFVDAFVMEYVEEYGFRLLPAGWKLLGKPDPNTFKPKERIRPEPVWVDATVQLTLF